MKTLGARIIVILLAFALLHVIATESGAQFTPPPTTVTATLPIVSTKTTSSNYTVSCPTCGTASGSVTNFTIVTANGFDGTVATSTTTPALTLKTAIGDGIVKSVSNAIVDAVAGTDYLAINGNGSLLTGLTFAQIGGVLAVAKGGTGLTTLAGLLALQAANNVAITGGSITGMPTPSAPTDVANKLYVDKHNALNAATAATITALPFSPTYSNGTAGVGATLTAGSVGALIVDGYSPALGDFVLAKNQVSTFQNGLYQLTTLGTGGVPYVLTRAGDFDTGGAGGNMVGNPLTVINGTTQAATLWALSVLVTTVGTDPVTFIAVPNGINEKCVYWDSTLAVTAQTVDLPVEWSSYTIISTKAKVSGGGSFIYTIQIGGTPVTGNTAITVNTPSNVNTTATAANTGTVNDIISVVAASPSGTVNTAYVCPVFRHSVN